MTRIDIVVNGKRHAAEVDDRTLLCDFLRGPLGLTGTNVGCDTSQCGACTVHLDGMPVKSCTLLAAQAVGREVTTIEGLSGNAGGMHPVQQAFAQCHGLQCGFCTPGMVMACVSLLQRHPQPDDAAILEGLSGNLCRCTGYVNIVKAVALAAPTGRCGK